MATGGKCSTDVSALNERIKELEKQVLDYKRRLDELRKAKSTTLVKTQKEMVEINAPNLGARRSIDDTKLRKLQKQLEDEEKRHTEEISKTKQTKPEIPAPCDHQPELERLQQMVLSLEDENSARMLENEQLEDQVSSLMQQLSVKEAQTCEKEEHYKMQVKKEWGDKYKEWIAQTEQKIEDLQQTNVLLQSYLKKSGHMPSSED